MRIASRLALSFGMLSVLSVMLLGGLVNFLLDRRFTDYLGRGQQQRRSAIADDLAALYAENGGWPTQPPRPEGRRRGMGPDDVIVVDNTGKEVMRAGRPDFHRGRPEVTIPILVSGKRVGTAYARLAGPMWGMSPAEADFRRQINDSILRAGLSSALLVVLACWLVARSLARPLGHLARSAEVLGSGDLTVRANLKGRDEIGQLGRAFDVMAERLQEAEVLRKQLTADIAHELRTPLSAVRGYLEGMQDGVLAPDEETLEACHRETMRLVDLVQDLQTLATSDAGGMKLALAEVDLREAVQQAVKAISSAFPEAKVELVLPADEIDCRTLADDELFQRAVRNLLVNACKYSPAGAPVTVRLTCHPGELSLQVRDRGVGISPEDLPRIFDRFYRADPSRTRSTGGSGLGLTLARSIARLHGGDLQAASQPGKGSLFTLTLPRTPASDQAGEST